MFEGGFRVPAAITWSERLPRNEIRDQFAVNADWMPTLAELCDIKLNTKDLDGKSLMPVIKNAKAKSQHNEIFSWQHGNQWATRNGKWKLLGNPVDKTNKAPLTDDDKIFLVNLETDTGEMTNLAKKYPEKVKQLESQFQLWLEGNKN